MYAYVFDSFVQEQKYRTESIRIETRLATLGIQGRTEKITILKNLQESVRTMLKRGAETIVAVGNDQTVAKILPLIIESDAALGIIPVGQHQLVAHALGIPDGVAACDMLSRRIIRRIDLGSAGGMHFLLHAKLPSGLRVHCDHAYSVETTDADSTMLITNLGPNSRPDDGKLELTVSSPGSGWMQRGKGTVSVFPISEAKIDRTNGETPILLDGQIQVNPPVTITVLKKKLHVIVGRERSFE